MAITTRASAKKEESPATRSKKAEPKKGTAKSPRTPSSARPQVEFQIETRGTKRKAAQEAAEQSSPSKKSRHQADTQGTKRKLAQVAESDEPRPIKKPRKSTDSADEVFRKTAIAQFSDLKLPSKKSTRASDKDIIPFLKAFSQPRILGPITGGKGKVAPDAYILTSAQAQALFSSNCEILAPVFVANGARPVFNNKSKARPFEQVLNEWFVDPTELHECNDASKPGIFDSPPKMISELRERFLANNGYVKYPWNLPDIPAPFQQRCLPEYLQSMNCNLLRDIMRIALNVSPEGICPETCPKRKHTDQCCDKNGHELTFKEYMELQRGQAAWEGTLMLADAGATTFAHWDMFSFGTWISCYEGEVGFAWLSNPTDAERKATREAPRACVGKWCYRVVRPGESLYMPPGTIHAVFRKPHGKQTLCMAGHMLRRSTDLPEWLKLMLLEAKYITKYYEDLGVSEYAIVMPVLVKTIRAVLERHAGTEQEIARFGGKARLQAARKTLKALESATKELVKVAREDK